MSGAYMACTVVGSVLCLWFGYWWLGRYDKKNER